MIGYTHSELLAQSFNDLVHPHDCPQYQASLQALRLPTQTKITLEQRLMRKSGSVIWVSVTASLISAKDQPPLLSLIVQDISDSRAQVQRQAEFISTVSHELRTPLTAIQGSLGLLKAGVYDTHSDKGRRMLEIADLECDRLVRLINEILNFEHLRAGEVPLRLQACEVDNLLQQAANSLQAIAQKSL